MHHKTIAFAMICYGGEFVRSLGRALGVADAENAKRILTAFPEIIEKYRAIAERETTNG